MEKETNSIRKIYHGSDHIIERPSYGAGKPYNDYGRGFYCTEDLDMAKEWGARQDKNGIANCYTIDCDGLTILNLNDPQYCILHWLSVLIENREFDVPSPLAVQAKQYILENFHVNYKKADCMIGYRADDSYFSFAQDFLNGTISYRQLNHAMHLGKLGEQFVLKSKQAFERITYTGYEFAGRAEWYSRKVNRDRTARREYFHLERNLIRPDDIFITRILSEEMKENDPRLR
ncbi:MAG: DUF3990 domain-containing protein [Clostridiales bacterium]|nr:DUF3990 domain-containing protein [Clostridiales bacterium]